MNRIVATLFIAVGLIAAGATRAQADTLNCTSGSCLSSGLEFSFGGVNYASFAGALWSVTDYQPTGSGVIDSFVRISKANTDVVDGMNTSARPLANDENTSPTFTTDLLRSSIGTVSLPTLSTADAANVTETYYQFLLDINQTAADPLLSMSAVKICSSNTAGSASVADNCVGTLQYNLDASADNNVKLDYRLNNGSGSGDLFMYIPTSLFGTNANQNKYIYLWSQFGLPAPDGNNDGYEEWAIRRTAGSGPGTPTPFNLAGTPEPASLILLGSGLVAGSGYLRRSRKKAAAAKLS